jgi:hypothetical protein
MRYTNHKQLLMVLHNERFIMTIKQERQLTVQTVKE